MNKSLTGKALSIMIPFALIFLILALKPAPFTNLLQGFLTPRIINVIFAVILVQVFSRTMKTGGFDVKLQTAIRMITRSKIIALIIPSSLFGLLPMPAGALVSAPFTEKAASFLGLDRVKTFFVNYWFRHVWEYSWPLYAGVILGAGILKISISKFAFLQSPLVFASIFIGLVPLLVWTKNHPSTKHDDFLPFDIKTVTEVFLPVVILFFLALIFKININLSLLLSIGLIHLLSKIPVMSFFKSLKSSIFSFTTLLIITVLFLKTVIDKSHALTPIYNLLVSSGISPIMVGMGIAFVSGFFTGITQASVGITFPVFLSLLQHNIYLAPLLFTSGFMGVMVSPFHLCYLTTKEYFKLSTRETHALIVPSAILMIIISLFYVLI